MEQLLFNSIENLPGINARAAFTVNSSAVFREELVTVPIRISDRDSYMPRGGDDQMPYNILKLIEDDETLSTCQQFNAEVCYGSGLQYRTDSASPTVVEEVEDFFLANNIPGYFLGTSQDFKHFRFAVSVIMQYGIIKVFLKNRQRRLRKRRVCHAQSNGAGLSRHVSRYEGMSDDGDGAKGWRFVTRRRLHIR